MIAIRHLNEYKNWIPIIAEWYYSEWPDVYPNMEFVIQRLSNRTNTSSLPIGLVAVENEEVIGAVTIKEHDIETMTELSPWLASLIVKKERRNEGIGKLLINGVLEKSGELGFHNIYLYTDTAKDYYALLGWDEKEEIMHKEKRVSIFERIIG